MRHIFVLIGKAGVGKTSIAKQVVADSYDLVSPVGTTTRNPRDGEKHGVDYDFIDLEMFNILEDAKMFIDTTTYKGHRYGYQNIELYKHFALGLDTIAILTPKGYEAFKEYFKDEPYIQVTPVVIHPASEEERLENLKKRGSEASNDDEIDLSDYKGWSVCNYDLETSVRQVKKIIEEARKGL